jgi:hypothetical protein
MKGKTMRTITSIEMRAKVEALKKVQKEMIQSIQEEIATLMMGIEDEENKNGDLPDDME